MSNQTTYEDERVVRVYAQSDKLQKPEETVLSQLRPRLKDMRMLDIGVGGGRTTIHFAPAVKEYIGIDYSQKMLEACANRFSEHRQKYSFRLCDARSMGFPDNYFDFVFFSYNGIDYVPPHDRNKILYEVARVTCPRGYFFFSTHNLNSDVEEPFSATTSRGVKGAIAQASRRALFRFLNRDWRRARENADHMIINDGAHGFRLQTYYIKPAEQIRQLQSSGFADVRVFAHDGRELKNGTDLEQARDPWLHYLCNAAKTVLLLRIGELLEFELAPYLIVLA